MSGLLKFSTVRWILSFTGIENHNHVFILFLHILLLFIVGIELGKATTRSTVWKLSPPILFILSFVVLIVIGSSLLMLPEMTNKKGMPFIDALFTSISANCVTGLIVVDTATYFTLKGKMLILLLIQLGGLNIIAFATYFISFLNRSIEGKMNVATIKELLHTESLDSIKSIIKMVVLTSFVIELLGTVIIYLQLGTVIKFASITERLFYSAFHSISAFNNAGFSLFTNGLTNIQIQGIYPIHMSIAVLIVLGGLGFTTLQNTLRWSVLKERGVVLTLQSKIALVSSLILILVGTGVFFLAEADNSMVSQDGSEQILISLFQSITTRTAGFNTVDLRSLTTGVLIMFIMLMFIGASSGSTGGGIKTSTFSVLLMALWKAKERKDNYGRSFITISLVKKSLIILLYSLGVIVISTFILLLIEPEKLLIDLLFEEVSAFGTVGLSTGITSSLSQSGKALIMLNMVIGRLGPLTLAYALIKSTPVINGEKESEIMIG